MKILILSWRDTKHPFGGGAELLSHEMAKRWVKWGYEVTHFSASFPGAKEKELLDGVMYLRYGSWLTVHILAFFKIIFGQLPKFDVVIDEVHGFPFFSSLYTRKPTICLACEVAQDIWDQMYPFPVNFIGKIIERIYLLLYRNIKFLTISQSTKDDLIRYGVKENNITIIPMGFSYSLPENLPSKDKNPLMIFLGRLVKTKGVEDAIKAFAIVCKFLPTAKMCVVGRGLPLYEEQLKNSIVELGLTEVVEFKGFVSTEEKYRLLARSHLIFVPSSHEGWGLIVPEANIVGTVAVVYNVHGLRDVTKPGLNGLVTQRSPEALAEAAVGLLADKKRYNILSDSAREYAKSMNWDNTARSALSILEQENHSKP